jgi:nicotinate-nucleotide adenylyltransferase
MRRIGILGGTFDPIHLGHTDAGGAAEELLGLTRMHVIPASIPPHRPQAFTSAYHRFAMVALAAGGRANWRASDLELRGGDAPSYTSLTLRRFHERGYMPSELFFIIGADAFTDISAWNDYPDILDRAHFAVISRPGCPVAELPDRLPLLASRMVIGPIDDVVQVEPVIILIDEPTRDVSSSAIRRCCAGGLSIAGMVHPGVQQHIEQHGLYGAMIPGRRGSDEPFTASAGRLHDEG